MPDPTPPGDITLGEVWRGLQDLKTILKESLAEYKAEIDTAVEAKTSALKSRVDRLERLVYGGIMLMVADLVAAIIVGWMK
jgi:hypothetical protein